MRDLNTPGQHFEVMPNGGRSRASRQVLLWDMRGARSEEPGNHWDGSTNSGTRLQRGCPVANTNGCPDSSEVNACSHAGKLNSSQRTRELLTAKLPQARRVMWDVGFDQSSCRCVPKTPQMPRPHAPICSDIGFGRQGLAPLPKRSNGCLDVFLSN